MDDFGLTNGELSVERELDDAFELEVGDEEWLDELAFEFMSEGYSEKEAYAMAKQVGA